MLPKNYKHVFIADEGSSFSNIWPLCIFSGQKNLQNVPKNISSLNLNIHKIISDLEKVKGAKL